MRQINSKLKLMGRNIFCLMLQCSIIHMFCINFVHFFVINFVASLTSIKKYLIKGKVKVNVTFYLSIIDEMKIKKSDGVIFMLLPFFLLNLLLLCLKVKPREVFSIILHSGIKLGLYCAKKRGAEWLWNFFWFFIDSFYRLFLIFKFK